VTVLCVYSAANLQAVCEKILAVVASVGSYFWLLGIVTVGLRLVGPGEYFWLLEAPKVLIGAGPSVVAHLDCA